MMKMVLAALAGLSLHWSAEVSNTDAGLRGLCVVSGNVVWASGTKGTVVTTSDGGAHWLARTVEGAEGLDFRDVEAFDEKTAYLLASGEGAKSRVYKTTDGGGHWAPVLRNPDEKGFFDSLAFWDREHGILVGDPVDGHFAIFTTADGGTNWQRRAGPAALEDEGAFAASGTSVVTKGKKDAWFGTGGPKGGRVWRTKDGGASWRVAETPLGGTKTAGIFSLALADGKHGVAVGGDYQKPKAAEHSAALTRDGGKTWNAAAGNGYRSGVAALGGGTFVAVGTTGSDVSRDGGRTWEHFSDANLNAVGGNSGGVWGVGPKGAIVKLEER